MTVSASGGLYHQLGDGSELSPAAWKADLAALEETDGDSQSGRRDSVKPLVALGVLAAVVVLVIEERSQILLALKAVLMWGSRLGPFAGLLVAAVIVGVTLIGLPTCPLYICTGVMFANMYSSALATVVGCASCCSGAWLGNITAFHLGRTFLKPYVERKIGKIEAMVVMNKIIEKEGWKFAFVMRLSPFLPAEVFNYACSMTSMSFSDNCFACLGSMPMTAFWVWTSVAATRAASSDGTQAISRGDYYMFMGVNVVVIVLMVFLVRTATKQYQAYVDDAVEEPVHKELLGKNSFKACGVLRKESPLSAAFARSVSALTGRHAHHRHAPARVASAPEGFSSSHWECPKYVASRGLSS